MRIDAPILRRRARVEMIPILDCIFILLVFFIYSMLAMTVQRGMIVRLPGASAGATVINRDEAVVITIGESGEMQVNDQHVTPETIAAALDAALAELPTPRVVINGDAGARHGRVVEVLDLLRRREIEQVLILAREETP
ncbi:MAG: biopolymer transporter ExbD [Phycisphaeraceae bacterium]|nr:biopolymer transporter ExbD [Phycisphaerales bacterium]QOJ18733.1 MAG: biopolymer transporter ExbD [Phycisphaeraceae bacterium]